MILCLRRFSPDEKEPAAPVDQVKDREEDGGRREGESAAATGAQRGEGGRESEGLKGKRVDVQDGRWTRRVRDPPTSREAEA